MGRFGGRVEYVDYRVQCRMLEQPAFRRLSCWQARASELCEGVVWRFAPGPRAQETGLSSLGGWSLTSCSALFTCSLYPRDLLRSRGMRGFGF